MIKIPKIAALLALSSVAALPACSMFGGGDNGSSRTSSNAGYSRQSYAPAAPSYSSGQMAASTELTPDMIRNVQQKLSQEGMYRGQADGMWGPQTQAAVRSYQQQHNMNPTGQLDQDTLAAMDLGGPPTNQRYGSNYNPPPNNGNPNSQQANTNQPSGSSTTR